MSRLQGAASAAADVLFEELKNAIEWAIATEGQEDRVPLLREVQEIVSEPGALLRLLMEANGHESPEAEKLRRELERLKVSMWETKGGHWRYCDGVAEQWSEFWTFFERGDFAVAALCADSMGRMARELDEMARRHESEKRNLMNRHQSRGEKS